MYQDTTDNTCGLADDITISDVALHMSEVVAETADARRVQMILRP